MGIAVNVEGVAIGNRVSELIATQKTNVAYVDGRAEQLDRRLPSLTQEQPFQKFISGTCREFRIRAGLAANQD